MKLAVILGAFSVGNRPLSFEDLWSSPRGLTGTDLCFVRTCEELAKRGHWVYCYTPLKTTPELRNGMVLRDISQLGDIDTSFDAAISINEPNVLKDCRAKKRVVWQMLNDFSFVQPGFDTWVDKYFGVCDEHTAYVARQCPNPDKWSTIPLGCDPDRYEDRRVKGRVFWCSSADRGLMHLLSMWPEIKSAVPEATLRVAYHFSYDSVFAIEQGMISPQGRPYSKDIVEMAQRVRYIRHALPRLKHLGVEHIGSVSRNQMLSEWSEASVFAYPCDTVSFSEGFSVSTLEAHASFTVPVISDADCLGGIYKDSGCIMVPEVRHNLECFRDKVIEALRGEHEWRIEKCREFAKQRTWAQAIEKLESSLA